MNTTIENEYLHVAIQSKGAELTQIKGKQDGIDYLWSADPTYWAGHAPILFPIVGRVYDGQYHVNGQSFSLGTHGFAKDYDFMVAEHTSNRVTYQLTSDESTQKIYPYAFTLFITYTLTDNRIDIEYKIVNPTNDLIYFCIGAHPGFQCPLFEGEQMEDYYLEFEKNETADIWLVGNQGYFTGEHIPYLNNEKTLPLSKDLFKNDALVFKNLQSRWVSIKSHKNNKVITVHIADFPYLGIWSKAAGAPFVCIEPWYGHGDYYDFTGDFREKEGVQILESNETFTCTHSISIQQ